MDAINSTAVPTAAETRSRPKILDLHQRQQEIEKTQGERRQRNLLNLAERTGRSVQDVENDLNAKRAADSEAKTIEMRTKVLTKYALKTGQDPAVLISEDTKRRAEAANPTPAPYVPPVSIKGLQEILYDNRSHVPREVENAVRNITTTAGELEFKERFKSEDLKDFIRSGIRDRAASPAQAEIDIARWEEAQVNHARMRDTTISFGLSELSRYKTDVPLLTTDDQGNNRMASFTMSGFSSGFSLTYEAKTGAFAVLKDGQDITEALFAGTAFSKGPTVAAAPSSVEPAQNESIPTVPSDVVSVARTIRNAAGTLEIGKLDPSQVDNSAILKRLEPLAAYPSDGPLFSLDRAGNIRLESFTLSGLPDAYSVRYDAKTAALTILKNGQELTEKLATTNALLKSGALSATQSLSEQIMRMIDESLDKTDGSS